MEVSNMSNFCKNCGAKLDGAKKFCTGCGQAVQVDALQQPAQAAPVQQPVYQPQFPAKKKSKAPLIIVIVVVLIAAIATAAFFTNGFGLFGGGNDTPSGGNNTPSDSSTPSGNSGTLSSSSPAAPDLSGLIGGSVILSNADPATQQALIDEARKDGGDIEFRADGSVVYTDPDGSVLIQKPDGTWKYQDADGGSASVQYGGDWPENEFTKLLPKPDFTLTTAIASESEFTVVFQGATLEQIKAYVEKVKSAGFTMDAEVTDEDVMGMAIYSYDAQNAAGYKLNIFSAAGTSGLNIEKP